MERCSFNRNDPGYALDPLFHSKFSQYFVHNPNECKLALSKGVTRKNRYPRFVVASFSLLEILGEDCLQLSRERKRERKELPIRKHDSRSDSNGLAKIGVLREIVTGVGKKERSLKAMIYTVLNRWN